MITSAASLLSQNSLINQASKAGISSSIIGAIKNAANQTGVDFTYLLKKAAQESSFDPNAKASTSSATGLYQFTQQTWLQTVKNTGSQYGLSDYADHISIDKNGIAHVKDPTWRQAILNMRKDPVVASEMSGELDKENQTSLQDNVGGKIGGTELYLAHFLGAGGASDFLNEMRSNPKQTAANVLPEAAAANPSVFYSKDGTPRSLQQIYQHFAKKFDDNTSATTLIASASPAAASTSSAANTSTDFASTFNSADSAAPMTVASNTTLSQAAASSTIAVNGLKAEGSSLFATMLLSQMQDEGHALSTATSDSHDKKTAVDMLTASEIG